MNFLRDLIILNFCWLFTVLFYIFLSCVMFSQVHITCVLASIGVLYTITCDLKCGRDWNSRNFLFTFVIHTRFYERIKNHPSNAPILGSKCFFSMYYKGRSNTGRPKRLSEDLKWIERMKMCVHTAHNSFASIFSFTLDSQSVKSLVLNSSNNISRLRNSTKSL